MSSISNECSAANKALTESKLAAFHELMNIMLPGTEKDVELNSAAVKASAEESALAVTDLSATKDPQSHLSAGNKIR